MKTINLRWMYPHYRHDEFVDVTDEVWAAMYQAKREMENYERRKVYHRAYYSLDAVSYTHLVTEELKACDPMRWVGLMNTLTAQIEEILIRELICS